MSSQEGSLSLKFSMIKVLRLKTGEELISSLKDFAKKQKISGAWFLAIGAADRIEIAFYDLKKKRYVRKKFSGRLEILSISGNISLNSETTTEDSDIVIHAHGIFAKPNYSTIGGHIISCRISATCEVFLQKTKSLFRKYDQFTGLNLLE